MRLCWHREKQRIIAPSCATSSSASSLAVNLSVRPSVRLAALAGNIRASRIANLVEEAMHSDEAPAHAMVIGLEEESIDGGQHTSVRPRKLLNISYW